VPARARATAYRSVERYGLVWVALDEPRWPLPEVPELEDTAWRTVPTGPFAWRCDASRQVENFTDFGHFAFVHEGLLGDSAQAVVAPHAVRADGHVLRYAYGRPDVPNTADFPVFAAEERKEATRRTRYALHLPYTIVEHIDWGGADGMVYFFASQPVADDRCVGYCLVARNYNLDQPDEVVQAFERTIFGQDQRVVESQRPEQVPFDLAAELHLSFDAVAVAYRRAMRAHGLTPAP
jgi:vanillate O-demethylase monooxygenase subunit